jgi:hypothetical protein
MKGFHGLGKERRGCPGFCPGGHAVYFAALLAIFLAGPRSLPGQVAPSADAGGLKLTVGATATGYALEYGERKMMGVAAIADADTNRRIGIEGEAAWLIFRQTANIHTATWLIGPRYHLTFGRFQPYAKGLLGIGQFNYPYNLGRDTDLVIAPGGGVDFRFTRRVRLRLADFEYQYWPQFHYGELSSYGISSGIRVRIF